MCCAGTCLYHWRSSSRKFCAITFNGCRTLPMHRGLGWHPTGKRPCRHNCFGASPAVRLASGTCHMTGRCRFRRLCVPEAAFRVARLSSPPHRRLENHWPERPACTLARHGPRSLRPCKWVTWFVWVFRIPAPPLISGDGCRWSMRTTPWSTPSPPASS